MFHKLLFLQYIMQTVCKYCANILCESIIFFVIFVPKKQKINNMERIWSPWRSQYIDNLNDNDKKNKIEKKCFLCDAINSDGNSNKENLIVARREKCIIIMNKYPYNSGHTLIVPLRHIADFLELENEELVSIMNTIQEVVAAIKQLFNPHGFNIGINIGQSAGAGLPDHLHFHIVPRWNGDANFTTTVADIKIISHSIEDTRAKLAEILIQK